VAGTGLYALPANVRLIEGAKFPDDAQAIHRISRSDLDRVAPDRPASGRPGYWAPAPDDASDPPLMQVELYPVPDAAYAVVFICESEAPTVAGTATTLLPWLRPAALVAGATADVLEASKDYAGADRQEAKFAGYVEDMVRNECFNRGSQPMRAASWISRRNVERNLRNAGLRTGPRLP